LHTAAGIRSDFVYTPEQIKEARLDDFRVFLTHVWKELGLPKPTRIQLDIAWWLQHGPERMVIMAFRGVGKSWITAAFSAWQLFLDPNKKIEVVSAGGTIAEDISRFIQDMCKEIPFLQHLAPPPNRKAVPSWSVGPAKTSKDPSVKAAGITGQITGTRADIIIPDDIEIPKNSYTHHLRQKLLEQTKEFSAILKPNEGSRIIYLGTPQVEESVYNALPGRGYRVLVWPAEVPKPSDMGSYEGRLAPIVQRMIENGAAPGTPTDPERFPRHVLDEKLAEYGKSGYSLQFMLNTAPASADKHPLKLSDLVIEDLDPEVTHVKVAWGRSRENAIEDLPAGGLSGDRFYRAAWKSPERAPYGGSVMAIDPSGRGKDELAYAIVKHLYSKLYLVDIGGFRDGYAESTLKALAGAAARHRVRDVIYESNFGGGMFGELFKPYLQRISVGVCDECKGRGFDGSVCKHKAGRLNHEWNGWSTGQKELRILNTLEPVVQQHRLIVDRRIIERDNELLQDSQKRPYSLVYQFTRLTRDRGALAHDDRLEALSMACAFWMERMSMDQDVAVDKRREQLIDEEIRRWEKDRVGVRRASRYVRV
jgi:hypothetical protein